RSLSHRGPGSLIRPTNSCWLGRKTQRGFYDYRGDKPIPTR
ncbi:MAG: hypothetical protein QOJ86_4275, partial [Bradyrhizobium sp.]|nr:hypothetical protein [Bradyrhizobium sp.]